jgi:hypothetical protein
MVIFHTKYPKNFRASLLQPRLNSKSVSYVLDLFPRIRHFQGEIRYVYVMYVMKKNCNLYFWKIVVQRSSNENHKYENVIEDNMERYITQNKRMVKRSFQFHDWNFKPYHYS